jgi:hypothetical protein
MKTISESQLREFATMNGLGAQVPASFDRRLRIYVANFSTAIAAGASAQTTVAIASDHDFVMEDMRGDFLLSAASGSAVAGTPLPRDASITAANNTMLGSLAHILLQFSLQQLEWSSDPIPANLVLGDARSPGYFLTLPRIAASDRLTITAQNTSNVYGAGVSVLGRIAMFGYAIPRNANPRA